MKPFYTLIISLVVLSCASRTNKERLLLLKSELESIKSYSYDLDYRMERLNSDRQVNRSEREIIHCEINDSIFGYKWSKLSENSPMYYDGVNIVQLYPELKEAWCDTIRYVECPMPLSPGIIHVKSLINYSVENFHEIHFEIGSNNDTIEYKFRFDNLNIGFNNMTPFAFKSQGDTTFCNLYLTKNLQPLRYEHKHKHQITSFTFSNFVKIDKENKGFNALETIPIDFKRTPIYN